MSTAPAHAAPERGGRWQTALASPAVVELRRRRRRVTTVLMGIAAVGYLSFLGAFAYAPDAVADTHLAGVPLSLWLLFSQFALTWVLLGVHTRLTRTYLEPAQRAAVAVVGHDVVGHGEVPDAVRA
jgi:uncharacterized membrane protein (DUF485 family)